MTGQDRQCGVAGDLGIDDTAALDRVISARYSCRAYLDRSVPRSTIEAILTTSQKAASWCNSQAWQLHVTEGQATDRFRHALSTHAVVRMDGKMPRLSSDFPVPERYEGVYRERRRECGLRLYASMGISPDDREESAAAMLRNFSLFDAPHFMLVTTPRDLGTYGAVDCGGFISLFTTVARAHGVASIAQGAIAAHAPFVRRFFEVPDDRLILCGISFGYEDRRHPANRFRTSRAAIAEAVTWIEG